MVNEKLQAVFEGKCRIVRTLLLSSKRFYEPWELELP
jgi:hypothetical protein